MSSSPQPAEGVIAFAVKSSGLYQSAFAVILLRKKQSPNSVTFMSCSQVCGLAMALGWVQDHSTCLFVLGPRVEAPIVWDIWF